MKRLDEEDRKICSFQAKLFEASASCSNSGSAVFIRRFMRSDYARRIDQGFGIEEPSVVERIIEEIESKYPTGDYGSEKYAPMELHWIGYVYRYFCMAYGLTSKEAYAIVGAREMRSLYYPYHTLDTVQVIGRIYEAKELRLATDVSYGVEVLKKIRS